MQLDLDADVWSSFDEDEELDNDEMREQCPEGFIYSCCGDSGDSKGCKWGTHRDTALPPHFDYENSSATAVGNVLASIEDHEEHEPLDFGNIELVSVSDGSDGTAPGQAQIPHDQEDREIKTCIQCNEEFCEQDNHEDSCLYHRRKEDQDQKGSEDLLEQQQKYI